MSMDTRSLQLGNLHRESPSKLVDGVVQNLEVAISVGLLAQNEALPSEADLASRLSVSTVTLRQALIILRERGLIQTRRGRGGGSYVQDANQFNDARVTAQLRAMSAVELRELGDINSTLVGGAARLAALRALPEEVSELENLATAFALAETTSLRRRIDCRFHIQIGMAAQSTQLTTLIIQAMGNLGPLLWATQPIDASTVIEEQQALLEAIRGRSAHQAQETAILNFNRRIEVLVNQHLALATDQRKEKLS